MKTVTVEIVNKVKELLAVLDRDIQHVQETLSRLNELRAFVIKRDDVSLASLLDTIQAESRDYAANESKRNAIRRQLADMLGCSYEQMTLSRLETILSTEEREQIGRRKKELRLLAEKLRKEHLSTAMLLSACARFNGKLLKSIFQPGKAGTVTYNSSGHTKRHTDTGLVNIQF